MAKPQVAIIMGSDSDIDIIAEAAEVLEELGVPVEVDVKSAHRTPDETAEYVKSAAKRGLKVIIAGAGKSAHLGGVAAANTLLPVLAIPIKRPGDGDVAMKSNAEMPPGVPLAVMPTNGGKNAALFAAEILALSDSQLHQKLEVYRKQQHDKIVEKSRKLRKIGWRRYLDEQK